MHRLRDRLRVSQREMARLLAVSNTSIHKYEAGAMEPKPCVAWRYIRLAREYRHRLRLEDIYPEADT